MGDGTRSDPQWPTVCPSSSSVRSRTFILASFFNVSLNHSDLRACVQTRLTRRNRVFFALCNANALRIPRWQIGASRRLRNLVHGEHNNNGERLLIF